MLCIIIYISFFYYIRTNDVALRMIKKKKVFSLFSLHKESRIMKENNKQKNSPNNNAIQVLERLSIYWIFFFIIFILFSLYFSDLYMRVFVQKSRERERKRTIYIKSAFMKNMYVYIRQLVFAIHFLQAAVLMISVVSICEAAVW